VKPLANSKLVACAFILLGLLVSAVGALAARHTGRRELVAPPPPAKPIDWTKVTREASELLSNYIRINTTNPPGNELAAARMLREKFLADGIPATVWESAPGRGNVAARLHGIGKNRKALVLLSHIDVVPARAENWQVPPFSGELRNGQVWGRGALDDKGPGVVELMAMLAIKRAGILLDRDVLFLATSDEEEGGKYGAAWMVQHAFKTFADAGFLLNEGGAIQVEPHRPKLYEVSVIEKSPLWLRLTATGVAGHASSPPEPSAVTRLLSALNRLIDYRQPINVLPPVQNYFHVLAEIDSSAPRQFLDLPAALQEPDFARQFLSVPWQNALVRDTIAPTVLSAGLKTNVVPSSATAQIDCRLLPGENPTQFLENVRKLVDDKNVRIEVLLNFVPPPSPSRSFLMDAIRKLAQRDGKLEVVATLLAGFTDSHYFRERNIVAYGFIPLEMTEADLRTIHGDNERISVKNVSKGIQRMVDLLQILGGRL
jgi:acetylornithine deacetylase/succinyl-diaminopimelate desuccinylase-like protein